MFTSPENSLIANTLVNEINDTLAEQLCGGTIATPQTTQENGLSTMPRTGNQTSMPSLQASGALGVTPFVPNLPTTKLPRLGPLDPTKRTTNTPKNAVTITIPLPVWS
ncbi:hypothetical protein [Anabaena azotica]|uniref:hypothetical protein n=1 Tax=Anabaena azotica TaxID=197653 RepID=UPI0039A75AAA